MQSCFSTGQGFAHSLQPQESLLEGNISKPDVQSMNAEQSLVEGGLETLTLST